MAAEQRGRIVARGLRRRDVLVERARSHRIRIRVVVLAGAPVEPCDERHASARMPVRRRILHAVDGAEACGPGGAARGGDRARVARGRRDAGAFENAAQRCERGEQSVRSGKRMQTDEAIERRRAELCRALDDDGPRLVRTAVQRRGRSGEHVRLGRVDRAAKRSAGLERQAPSRPLALDGRELARQRFAERRRVEALVDEHQLRRQAAPLVVLGDVDGDGNLDVTSANGGSANGAVLRGNGDGTLQAAVTHAIVGDAISTDLGDLDGDGDIDWIVASYGGARWDLYANDGGGNFAFDQRFFAAQAGSCALPFDLDNDGDLDLALFDELADTIHLWENSAARQRLFVDRFEQADTSAWSSTVP